MRKHKDGVFALNLEKCTNFRPVAKGCWIPDITKEGDELLNYNSAKFARDGGSILVKGYPK